jgi:hypothetical protein
VASGEHELERNGLRLPPSPGSPNSAIEKLSSPAPLLSS